MKAFVKSKNRLIVNSQIVPNERKELTEFIDLADKKGVLVIPLYDTEGEVSGIEFRVIE